MYPRVFIFVVAAKIMNCWLGKAVLLANVNKTGNAMKRSHRVPLLMVALLVALLVGMATIIAQQAPDPRVADLVKGGRLRVALGLGTPALARANPRRWLAGVSAFHSRINRRVYQPVTDRSRDKRPFCG
jgi:hypothetical protein